MGDIFNSSPGVVAVVENQAVVPGRVKVGNFEPAAALISSIDYEQNTNQQFQTSLDAAVYIYVFGDQMGKVVVEGIAFMSTCEGSENGLKEILDFYGSNRASRKADPIQVVLGDDSVVGFLTGIAVRGNSGKAEGFGPGDASIFNTFRLLINTLPRG
jgi:hypothetical protein